MSPFFEFYNSLRILHTTLNIFMSWQLLMWLNAFWGNISNMTVVSVADSTNVYTIADSTTLDLHHHLLCHRCQFPLYPPVGTRAPNCWVWTRTTSFIWQFLRRLWLLSNRSRCILWSSIPIYMHVIELTWLSHVHFFFLICNLVYHIYLLFIEFIDLGQWYPI